MKRKAARKAAKAAGYKGKEKRQIVRVMSAKDKVKALKKEARRASRKRK